MFHLLGAERCYSRMSRLVSDRVMIVPTDEACSRRYGDFLHGLQPAVPARGRPGVELVDDPALEDILIDRFHEESALDDLVRYRDRSFFENGPRHRAAMTADRVAVAGAIQAFPRHDREFWRAFGFFVNYVMFPVSRYSRGGSDSSAIGAIYLSRPRRSTRRDLYELLVHEFTHTLMFLDELLEPHYSDEEAMVRSENYATAALTGRDRPVDKALHSLVVATELLLVRERTIGTGPTAVHPPSGPLRDNVRRTVASLEGVDRRTGLLGDRGRELVAACARVSV